MNSNTYIYIGNISIQQTCTKKGQHWTCIIDIFFFVKTQNREDSIEIIIVLHGKDLTCRIPNKLKFYELIFDLFHPVFEVFGSTCLTFLLDSIESMLKSVPFPVIKDKTINKHIFPLRRISVGDIIKIYKNIMQTAIHPPITCRSCLQIEIFVRKL